MGDDNTIRPFDDRWVPATPNFRVQPTRDSAPTERLTVSAWIENSTRNWEDSTVQQVVQPPEVEVVLGMSIPMVSRQDVLRWPHTRDGRATAR